MVTSRKRALASAAVVVVMMAVSACVRGPVAEPAYRYDRLLISRAEIEAAHQANAYELVQRARSRWLQPRGQDRFSSATPVVLYVNEQRAIGLDHLRRLRLDAIEEIRFVDPVMAGQRFGPGHGSGAILVTLR